MKKKTLTLVVSAALVFGSVGTLAALASCGGQTQDQPSEEESPYKVQITAIGQTTISVSKTLQLRTSVSGTNEKDVTWSSSDAKIATVNNRGLVTGVGAGKCTITATLKIDPKAKATIEVTVEAATNPTAIQIEGIEEGTKWVGDSAELKVAVTPEDASSLVTWSTSDKKVATIDENGVLNFIGEGNVTITATSTADTKISDSLTFEVKYGTFSATMGSKNWDISKQAEGEESVVTLPADKNAGWNALYYTHNKGTRYYAEAFFKIGELTENSWDWQGVGLGSGLSDTDARYFTFSPVSLKQANNFQKTIVRDRPTTWDALTQRSQYWNENGVNEIDATNDGVKVSMVRDENMYYYLLNDRLFYVDESTKYDGVETYPILVSEDLTATVTDFYATNDDAEIDAKLNSEEFKKSFFPCNTQIVEYNSDDHFKFTSNNVLSKDNKVRSIGDKAKVVRNFEIEFDVENASINEGHIQNGFTGLQVSLSRYDSADTVESFLIGRSKAQNDNTNIVAQYASWNYQMSFDNQSGHFHEIESTKSVVDNMTDKFHVKISRTINENNESEFKLFVNDQEVEFDYHPNSMFTSATERYTGAYLIWVGGEYTSAEITNFEFKSNI